MRQRLADFIEVNGRTIVDRAVQVAVSFSARPTQPDSNVLREGLLQILDAIVRDLRTVQSSAASLRKAQIPVVAPNLPQTAAGTYARLRAQSGFTLDQVVAEFRAFRVSVLNLWNDSAPPDEHALQDMTRFNEAVDQALAESVANFSAEIDGWRNMFIATLAHDLRGPLSVNVLTAEVLAQITPEGAGKLLVGRLQRSGARMKSLLDNLLDYSKASLGGGLRIYPAHVDLDPDLRDELDLLRALFPENAISYEPNGQTSGLFDASRVREALANLVINAAKHGDAGGRIRVRLQGDGFTTTLSVENNGQDIVHDKMSGLFMPFGHLGGGEGASAETDSLGLGLFIVDQIAVSHGGSVTVASTGGRTIFKMVLPSNG